MSEPADAGASGSIPRPGPEHEIPRNDTGEQEATRSIDENTRVWSQYMIGPDGAELEIMTVTCRRRSAGA